MVSRRSVLKGAVGATALSVPVVRGLNGAMAQEASPVASPDAGIPGVPAGAVVLAAGLMSPRYLTVAEDGSVYVTEAGVGGDEEIIAPPVEGTPEATASPVAAEPLGTRGTTGQVTKIAADGTVSVVASGLASYLIGGLEATGPAGIVLSGGSIWVAVGGPGPGTGTMPPIPTENSVVSIDEATGEFAVVADIGAYEIANNPDPNAVDSNVYGMDIGTDGALHVADAGGNTVYHVDPATGELTVLAVIPGLEIPEDQAPPGGNPERGGANEADPVPTGVAANPAGGVFVGLLSGFPFPAGGTKIVAIAEDGTVTDAGIGLTMCTDVAIGPDGQMYAVQISLNFLQEVPDPGNVVRVFANGTLEPVVEGLMLPNGIAFDAAGNLFIATGTVTPPGMDPAGMVLRIDGVAPPA
jgi:hypothetical protein